MMTITLVMRTWIWLCLITRLLRVEDLTLKIYFISACGVVLCIF